jgi:hypothetical protein
MVPAFPVISKMAASGFTPKVFQRPIDFYKDLLRQILRFLLTDQTDQIALDFRPKGFMDLLKVQVIANHRIAP